MEVTRHETRSVYNTEGDTTPIFGLGHSITTTLSSTVNVGVTSGIDVRVYLPVHSLRFDDVSRDRSRVGFGDPRFSIAAGPRVVGLSPVPVAIRMGVKLPGSQFPVDAQVIPLSEGQRDYEMQLEVGHSLYPKPVYLLGYAGFRWRELDRQSGRKPGDEFYALFAAGGAHHRLAWKIALEILHGLTPVVQNVPLRSAQRRMVQLLPSLGVLALDGTLEAGVRIPVSGRNLPAGPSISLGYFRKFE